MAFAKNTKRPETKYLDISLNKLNPLQSYWGSLESTERRFYYSVIVEMEQ
jgi:hypothetical protein